MRIAMMSTAVNCNTNCSPSPELASSQVSPPSELTSTSAGPNRKAWTQVLPKLGSGMPLCLHHVAKQSLGRRAVMTPAGAAAGGSIGSAAGRWHPLHKMMRPRDSGLRDVIETTGSPSRRYLAQSREAFFLVFGRKASQPWVLLAFLLGVVSIWNWFLIIASFSAGLSTAFTA